MKVNYLELQPIRFAEYFKQFLELCSVVKFDVLSRILLFFVGTLMNTRPSVKWDLENL